MKIYLYSPPSSPPEMEAKGSETLLHHFRAEQEIPSHQQPWNSSTWPHQPFQPVSLREAPLPPPASPSCLPWEVHPTGKKMFPCPDELFGRMLSSPSSPEQRGSRTRDLPAGWEGGQGHPLGSGLVVVVKPSCKFSARRIRDLLMGF